MLITTKKFYDLYIKKIDRIINNTTREHTIERNNLETCKENISNMCNKLNLTIKESEIGAVLVATFKDRYDSEFASEREKFLLFNLKSYIQIKKKLHKTKLILKEAEKKKVEWVLYKLIINTYLYELGKAILKGYTLTLFNALNAIYIKSYPRVFYDTNIDWDGSRKNKERLLREGVKPSELYSKENNPTGIKWFVYHNEELKHVLFWNNRWCRLPNKYYYSCKPIYAREDKDVLKEDFLKNCTSTDDILNHTGLGVETKMRYLLSYDDEYYLNFKRVSHLTSTKRKLDYA